VSPRSLARRARRELRVVSTFKNPRVFRRALHRRGAGTALLRTRSGLQILIRQNVWDARIVREMYIDKPYLRYFQPPPDPVVVDIGAYIGDFTLYTAHHLGARVVSFEPTAENYEIAARNVELNGLGSQVTLLNKAVGVAHELALNVERSGNEIHASSYLYADAEHRMVASVPIEEALSIAGPHVDLLKIDCEGGEYDIVPAIEPATLDRVGQVVLEYHRVDDWEQRFADLREHLEAGGFTVITEGLIVHALRGEARVTHASR
jgi:FkbM family methyltransferase